MALPFNKSVAQTMPGFGSPSFYGSGAQVVAKDIAQLFKEAA